MPSTHTFDGYDFAHAALSRYIEWMLKKPPFWWDDDEQRWRIRWDVQILKPQPVVVIGP